VAKRLKLPKLQSGDVFTLGTIDAFGVCIHPYDGWVTSAIFLDQPRRQEPGYISTNNIALIMNHGLHEFPKSGWEVVDRIQLPSDWHVPLQMNSENTAFVSAYDYRIVGGEEIRRATLVCDRASGSGLLLLYKLCKVVLNVDTFAGRLYPSPYIKRNIPDGFVQYCARMRPHWEEVYMEVNARLEAIEQANQ
jgi:hypothetical protein